MSAALPPLTAEQLHALAIVLKQAIRNNQVALQVGAPDGQSIFSDDWSAVVSIIDYEDAPPAIGVILGIAPEDVDMLAAD